jgi:hypothetical protein
VFAVHNNAGQYVLRDGALFTATPEQLQARGGHGMLSPHTNFEYDAGVVDIRFAANFVGDDRGDIAFTVRSTNRYTPDPKAAVAGEFDDSFVYVSFAIGPPNQTRTDFSDAQLVDFPVHLAVPTDMSGVSSVGGMAAILGARPVQPCCGGQAGGERRSSVKGNSRLPGTRMVAGGTCSLPGVWPMRR